MSLSLEETQALQTRLTEHIRDPEQNAPPPGIEDRRLKIYRELFYNNIEGFMQRGFPIIRKLLDERQWHGMVRDFMRRHPCQTPLFPEITQEFLAYLQGEREHLADEPAFLLELAHYEWVEVALDLADIDLQDIAVDPDGELLDGVPQLSPLLMSLAYQYPVHRIGPSFQPAEPGPEPTYLLVYRNREHAVKFMEANALTARLLALLEEEAAASGREILQALADEMQHPEPAQIVANGQITLDKFRRLDIILGTKSQKARLANS